MGCTHSSGKESSWEKDTGESSTEEVVETLRADEMCQKASMRTKQGAAGPGDAHTTSASQLARKSRKGGGTDEQKMLGSGEHGRVKEQDRSQCQNPKEAERHSSNPLSESAATWDKSVQELKAVGDIRRGCPG